MESQTEKKMNNELDTGLYAFTVFGVAKKQDPCLDPHIPGNTPCILSHPKESGSNPSPFP